MKAPLVKKKQNIIIDELINKKFITCFGFFSLSLIKPQNGWEIIVAKEPMLKIIPKILPCNLNEVSNWENKGKKPPKAKYIKKYHDEYIK